MTDKSLIGHELGATTFPVERGKIREFAAAVLDDRDEYRSPAPPAPPTFTMTSAFWPRVEAGPRPDLGMDMRRVLHAEQEFVYLRPVEAGDTLTGSTRIGDAYEKEGKRGGTMRFVVFETTFRNQRGEEAIVSRQVIVETSKAAN